MLRFCCLTFLYSLFFGSHLKIFSSHFFLRYFSSHFFRGFFCLILLGFLFPAYFFFIFSFCFAHFERFFSFFSLLFEIFFSVHFFLTFSFFFFSHRDFPAEHLKPYFLSSREVWSHFWKHKSGAEENLSWSVTNYHRMPLQYWLV